MNADLASILAARAPRAVRVMCRVAVAGLVLLAAGRAAHLYYQSVEARFSEGRAAYDLETFLRAASNVLNGVSPYTYRGDATYAYPPTLAVLVSPFSWLSAAWANLAWMLVSGIMIALALWLLGVRDWRCYALSADYPFVKDALLTGTAAPLLLLLVAVGWRLRDVVVRGGAAVGAAVALKLFLWPVALWLAVTRRLRTALLAVAFAVTAVLLPWALIGFAGMSDYPRLLRHLSHDEAIYSFSLVALGVRARLSEQLAAALAAAAAIALLVAAYWVVRGKGRNARDRDALALTLTLAAGLAASPIVWLHSFLLLLVPLALTRPSLSAFWVVPFAYVPTEAPGWPSGDIRRLTTALVATAAIVVGAAVLTARRPPILSGRKA